MEKIEVTKQGSQLYAVLISLIAAVGGFLFGFDLSIVAGARTFLIKAFALSDAQTGFAMASAILGCIFGALNAAWLSDVIGRKKSLIIAAILFGISAIGTALPQTIAQFNIFRIVGGIGVGLAAVISPMYIAEIAPARIRGSLVTLNQLAIVIGSLVAIIVSWLLAKYVSETTNWRWMFGSEGVAIIMFFLGLSLVPESPRWLVQKNKQQEAMKILIKVDGQENANLEMKAIENTMTEETGSFFELLLPGIRKAFIVGIVLAVLQQWCGSSVLFLYAPMIFEKAGFQNPADAIGQTVILNIWNLFCTIAALLLVDRLGRRPLLLFSTLGMCISLIIMGVVFVAELTGIYVLVAFFLCVGTYVVGIAPLAWLIMSEIFPTRIRGKGMSTASLFVWVSAYVSVHITPMLTSHIEKTYGSVGGFFWIFAVICGAGFLFSLKMVPETKGKTLEKIAELWLHKKGKLD